MNENVEAIYTQMFAPNPIPDEVKEMFDRVNFLASRIDAQAMRPTELAMIAAVAISTKITPKYAGPKPAPALTVDTTEQEPEPEETEQPARAPTTLTGPMDAPSKPRKDAGKTIVELQSMEARELRAHVKEFYEVDVPDTYSKKQCFKLMSDIQKSRKQGIE
jgi:hypothetical protein